MQLTRHFTPDHWPFKGRPSGQAAIVDHVHKLPEGRPRADLLMYVFTDPDAIWAGIITRDTAPHWFVHAVHDRNHNISRDYVWCPLEHIKWRSL